MLSEIASWNKQFKALQQHLRFAHSFETTTSNTLHAWINEQRVACAQGRLSPERRERLEMIGFLFTTDAAALAHQTWQLHLVAIAAHTQRFPRYTPPAAKRRRTALDRWLLRNINLLRAGQLDSLQSQQLRAVVPHLCGGRAVSKMSNPRPHSRALNKGAAAVVVPTLRVASSSGSIASRTPFRREA